jgi:diguanylate cyclase (GGDEF)-like protein
VKTDHYLRLMRVLDARIAEIAVHDGEGALLASSGPRLETIAFPGPVRHDLDVHPVRDTARVLGWLRVLRDGPIDAHEPQAWLDLVLPFVAQDLARHVAAVAIESTGRSASGTRLPRTSDTGSSPRVAPETLAAGRGKPDTGTARPGGASLSGSFPRAAITASNRVIDPAERSGTLARDVPAPASAAVTPAADPSTATARSKAPSSGSTASMRVPVAVPAAATASAPAAPAPAAAPTPAPAPAPVPATAPAPGATSGARAIAAPRGSSRTAAVLGSPDDLPSVARSAIGALQCQGAIIYLPSLGLAESHQTGMLQPAEMDRALELVRGHLWPTVDKRRRAMILNRFRITADGPVEPFRVVCVPIHRRGVVRGVLAAFNLRSEKRFEDADRLHLERLAIVAARLADSWFDAGTGLLTRQAFEDRVARQRTAYAHRARCIVYANVDRFHVVNDAIGMEGGDGVLRSIAHCLGASGLPEHGFVGRLSGDRFVAFLENTTMNGARAWAEKVQQSVREMPLPDGCGGLPLTVSFGIAPVSEGAPHSRALADAELACKAAKDRGRARIELYADADLSMVRRHDDLRVFRLLQDALAGERFRLYSQPIDPLRRPDAPREYEILLRMVAPDGQIVPPGEFLSAAQRYQVLDKLDDWVMLQAVGEIAKHGRRAFPRGTRFWINVSGQSLGDEGFADRAFSLVRRHRLRPGMLGFEITENAAVANLAAARRFIERLRDVGCDVKLDDFGTGLSSLSYLKELPVSGLKIDGSFVRGVIEDPRSRSVVTAVLGMARELGMETTAECVETQDVADQLAAMGVTYAQGYLYGKPRPLAELIVEQGGPSTTQPVALLDATAARPGG